MAKVQENENPIIFIAEDQGDMLHPHDDPLVIPTVIAKHPIKKILVDSGSSVNMLY